MRARYDYDPFGRRTKLTGNRDADFGFTGHYVSSQYSDLAFAPFRIYSSDLGRWISRDPIGELGGINLYGYVSNDPVDWTDPLGLEPQLVIYRGPLFDARPFIAPNGQIFLAPARANFDDVYTGGETNGTLGINDAVGHFGTFDFQRNEGKGKCPTNTFYPAYTDASNYAVGVYMNGAGYSLDMTLFIAGTFASLFCRMLCTPPQRQWWTNGWNAAQSGTPNYPLIFLANPGKR